MEWIHKTDSFLHVNYEVEMKETKIHLQSYLRKTKYLRINLHNKGDERLHSENMTLLK